MTFGFRLASTLLVLGTLACASAETAEDLVKRETANAFVQEKLAMWQDRLKLQDWNVSVVLTPRTHLKHGALGKIKWDKKKKTAVIWALDPVDYTLPAEEMLKDLEFTVVHELIHLELASLPKSEASRRSEEHAVNQLAEALLALARQ